MEARWEKTQSLVDGQDFLITLGSALVFILIH